MTGYLVVLCTAPDSATAERLARRVVESRLAACVNVVTGVVSIYRWKGEVHTDEERLLVIKTHAERWEALRETLVREHPYELPEVLALPVLAGHPPYLQWLDEGVGRP